MTNLSRHPVSGKLNRVIGFSLILSLLIMAVTVNLVERKYSRESLIRELEVISDMFANRSIASLLFVDVEAAERNLVSAKFHTSIDTVCLFDAKFNMFASYVREETVNCNSEYLKSRDVKLGQEKSLLYGDGNLILINPVLDNENVLGYILLVANETELIQEQLRLTSILIVLFSFTLILTYLFTRGIITGLLKPLHMLSQTAQTISKKRYDWRARRAFEQR